MILKTLKQRDLYHNPDPLGRLVGEANESKVIVEGQETRALLGSGSQLSAISWSWVKKLNLEPKQLQSILRIEGSGGLEVPYLGTLHIDMAIKLATTKELETLNKQWQRSLIATR